MGFFEDSAAYTVVVRRFMVELLADYGVDELNAPGATADDLVQSWLNTLGANRNGRG